MFSMFVSAVYADECISGDCVNGQGTMKYDNGSKYVGEFKDGNRNGQGTYTRPDGNECVGQWKDDKYISKYATAVYSGECISGDCNNGQGTMRFSDGSEYVGNFKDNKANGKGKYTWPDSSTYLGQFKDGKANGQGTYTFSSDGTKYEGQWEDGNRNGQGTMTRPDGTKYIGQWKDGKPDGQGTLTTPDGTKYVGQLKNGEYNGQVTVTLPDGTKYVGQCKDSKLNGQVTLTLPDGKKHVGQFKEGKLIIPSSPLKAINLTGNFVNPEKNCVIEFKQGRLRLITFGITNSWFQFQKNGNTIWAIKAGASGGDLELSIVNDTIVVEQNLETLLINGIYYKEGSSILFLKKLEEKESDDVKKK